MRFRTLLGLALCAAVTSSAQITNPPASIRSLSLRECVELALSKNLDLRIERLKLDMAADTLYGAYGVYDPVLSFTARRDFVSQPGGVDPKKPGSDFPYDLTTDSLGPTLTGVLPYGLSYDFNALEARQKSRTDFNSNTNNAASYPFGVRQTNDFMASAGVTLQQHLLKDFWIDQPRYEIQVNKKNLKIAELALLQQMMNIVTKTEVAYYDLTLAREEIGVQEMALAQARQLLAEDQRRVQMGMLPPAGEQDAAAQAETAQANLLAAQLAFASQQNVLKGLIGDDFRRWADVRLDPSDTLEAVETPLQRRECWDVALAQRPDIRQFRLELEKENLQVRYRFNQLFPSLEVVGSVGGRAVDSTFGDAFDQLGDFSNPRYSYWVVLSYPLSNRAARNAYRAS